MNIKKSAIIKAEKGDLLVLIPYPIMEEMVRKYATSFGTEKGEDGISVYFELGKKEMKARIIHAWEPAVIGGKPKRHQARRSRK